MAQEETVLLSFSAMWVRRRNCFQKIQILAPSRNLPLDCAQGCRLAVTARAEKSDNFVEVCGKLMTIQTSSTCSDRTNRDSDGNKPKVWTEDRGHLAAGFEPAVQDHSVSGKNHNNAIHFTRLLWPNHSYSVDQQSEVIQSKLGQADASLFSLLVGPNPTALPLCLDHAQKLPQPSMLLASVSQPENGGANAGTGKWTSKQTCRKHRYK
jgi:hypothetical protein